MREEEGGSRSPRLFITNVTSRWDLATPHPGRYLFPPGGKSLRWRMVNTGSWNTSANAPPPPMGSFLGFSKRGQRQGRALH